MVAISPAVGALTGCKDDGTTPIGITGTLRDYTLAGAWYGVRGMAAFANSLTFSPLCTLNVCCIM